MASGRLTNKRGYFGEEPAWQKRKKHAKCREWEDEHTGMKM